MDHSKNHSLLNVVYEIAVICRRDEKVDENQCKENLVRFRISNFDLNKIIGTNGRNASSLMWERALEYNDTFVVSFAIMTGQQIVTCWIHRIYRSKSSENEVRIRE